MKTIKEKIVAEQPLRLSVSLSQTCHADVTIQGEITASAIQRLISILGLIAEDWSTPIQTEETEQAPK